jgi:hypothetical protein
MAIADLRTRYPAFQARRVRHVREITQRQTSIETA